jgi:hypothetical protein
MSTAGCRSAHSSRAMAFIAGHSTGVYRNVPLHVAQNTITPSGGLNPGLYVQVLDGMINVSNGGGTQNFAAGQWRNTSFSS